MFNFSSKLSIFFFDIFHRSDRKEKDGEVKSRDRSGSRDREKRRRSRSGDRDRHRSRRDGDGRRESDKGDRGGSDRHRDRGERGGRDRERSRSRGSRRERGDRDNKDDRPKPQSEEELAEIEAKRVESEAKKAEADAKRAVEREAAEALRHIEREASKREREINDLTKDQRTVFVSQLTAKVNETMIRNFFDQLGTVNNIIMIRDKNSGRHKGFAYVEMGELEAIPNCLLFNNVVPDFQKFPILVKASEAEKNFNAKVATVATATKQPANGPIVEGMDCRLYIGNIHVNINESALKTVLDQFGPTENINLHRDESGTSKGFAFIRFSQPESAQLALANLAGVELAGRPLKVGRVIDNATAATTAATTSSYAPPTSGNVQDMMGMASANWKLDDDDGAKGMQMNAQNRAQLMAKLGQAAGIQVPNMPSYPVDPNANPMMYGYQNLATPVPLPQPLPPSQQSQVIPPLAGVPSTCFMIRNMFDPNGEGDGDWDTEIKEDVSEECSKYGNVEHCHVERNKPGGLVFLKFSAIEASYQAASSLNGRFFAGRMITVTFLDPALYFAAIHS